MFYSITCSTKILTMTIAPVLFISFGVLCELTILPDVYIFLSLQKE